MRRLLSRLLRRQEGIAMPTVIGMLTITTGLAAGTFAVVIEGNHASARDRDSKAALGAAEAGLQMASLRISRLEPGAEQCVTNSLVPTGTPSWDGTATAPSECPKWREPLGNGASYTYVVATQTSGNCPTLPTVPPATETTGVSRCITSTGEVNGVRRRLQTRFYFNPPHRPWGRAGLVGKHMVDIDNNAEINSPVGSNKVVKIGANSIINNKVLIPPGATFEDTHPTSRGATGGVETVVPWEFPDIDWATPRQEGLGLDGVPGWDPVTRILTLGQRQEVTLNGGSYHVCGIVATNNNKLHVVNGQVAHIYVDSPRGNPACPNVAGAGRLVIANSGLFNALDANDPDDQDPSQLAVFVYGTTDDANDLGTPDVDINNGVQFHGMIWAPNSTVSLWNNGDSSGGITAGNLSLKNNQDFRYDSRVADKDLPGTAKARNESWFECKRDPTTATDPESGCS